MIIDSNQPTSFYQPYLSLDEVRCGLESGRFIQGVLRVNQRNYEEAYVSNPDGDKFPDILILGLQNRNRAFTDDIVVVELNERDQWTIRNSVLNSLDHLQISQAKGNNTGQRRQNYNFVSDLVDKNAAIPTNKLQKTGKVVCISEQKGSRTAVGILKPTPDGKRNWGLFSPTDPRIPRMLIPFAQLPGGFVQRPQDFSKFLFVAEVHNWKDSSKMAHAKLFQCLGKTGDVQAESAALLISNKVDTREFPKSIEKSLPLVEGKPWEIDRAEFSYRKDFRNYTIFTIDPATARDLDDALHIKRIPNCDGKGNAGWEVGVHIADVSYFVKSGTELDEWARKRATSVYLVERVIPMLPRVLCEELCSLNPGVDRLTFSIVWKMDDNAVIKDQWIGRSVIRSCVKLSYEHAQEMIDNPGKEFSEADLPTLYNEKSITEIKESVLNLNHIGRILKKRRMDNGSLRIDGAKLRFALASKNGMPVGVGSDPRNEANFLVEELMLLANMQVARYIHSKFPETSLLRRHPPPKAKAIAELVDKLDLHGFDIEFSTGLTIGSSLRNFSENEHTALHVHPTLSQLVLRCMQLAQYFSSGTCEDYHHYALNVPFYTHFTSPIRRYPDLIVHRLLAASLDYAPKPSYTPEELQLICVHCNDQKVRAKAVSDGSSELFFGFFIREIGQLRSVGVVINVLDSSFDVFLVKYNLVRRVYTQQLKLTKTPDFNELSAVMRITWELEHVAESDKQRPPKGESTGRVAANIVYDDDLDEHELVLDNVVDEDGEGSGFVAGNGTQTLKVFSTVIVLLRPLEDSAKFSCIIEPTVDDYPLEFEEIKSILN